MFELPEHCLPVIIAIVLQQKLSERYCRYEYVKQNLDAS